MSAAANVNCSSKTGLHSLGFQSCLELGISGLLGVPRQTKHL